MFLVFGTSAKRKKAKTALFAPNNQAQWPTYNYRSIKITKVSRIPKWCSCSFCFEKFNCLHTLTRVKKILFVFEKYFYVLFGCPGHGINVSRVHWSISSHLRSLWIHYIYNIIIDTLPFLKLHSLRIFHMNVLDVLVYFIHIVTLVLSVCIVISTSSSLKE